MEEMAYSSVVLSNWDQFISMMRTPRTAEAVLIDGRSLNLANIVVVARYSWPVVLSRDCSGIVDNSARAVVTKLAAGDTIYAVNTGVGASADTRTTAVLDLQQAIIRTLNCGVIDDGGNQDLGHSSESLLSARTPLCDENGPTTMPQAWVKAAQLVRANSLASGDSGIRLEVLETFVKMLQENLVPQVPLRGSISASGDLSPLSYLAGALQGDPGIRVWIGEDSNRKLEDADCALKQAQIKPISFAPKEALALVNGTSVCAGVGALAMHDAHGCMVLGQVLTAMAVEALNGTSESFDAYFAQVRPHPGQMEAAHNISAFLKGSKLAREADSDNSDGLRQDRYALRTASQWIGPELESLMVAHRQVVVECNSITDNPLVKPSGTVLQGGNFQAMAVTSAMDKIRTALNTMSRMLFQQFTELMNPATNNGLPPNLTADDPSSDFLMKGMDIASASYQSELAFLSHSILPFVMVAEQGNQSLNSLALISARYTHTAIDMFMLLSANSLVALCQSLDLRVVQRNFLQAFEPVFKVETASWTQPGFPSEVDRNAIRGSLWKSFEEDFARRSNMECHARFKTVSALLHASAVKLFKDADDAQKSELYKRLQDWEIRIATQAVNIFMHTLDSHTPLHTVHYLGHASSRVYQFVRQALKVPFLRTRRSSPNSRREFDGAEPDTTLGTYIGRVYRALKYGTLLFPVMDSLREAKKLDGIMNVASKEKRATRL